MGVVHVLFGVRPSLCSLSILCYQPCVVHSRSVVRSEVTSEEHASGKVEMQAVVYLYATVSIGLCSVFVLFCKMKSEQKLSNKQQKQ